METPNQLPPAVQGLLEHGSKLKDDILHMLAEWPYDMEGERKSPKSLAACPTAHQKTVDELATHVGRWFNTIGKEILPHTLEDPKLLFFASRRVQAGVRKQLFARPLRDNSTVRVEQPGLRPYSFLARSPARQGDPDQDTNLTQAVQEVEEGMAVGFSVIKSAPFGPSIIAPLEKTQRTGHVTNTGFIMMWMDRNQPELEDVSNAIKEICRSFGIEAVKADDIEHEGKITELVLERIRSSEFLIADLTGERPNVYYEVGYAHALGKRPILYRKEDTKLHFDLSVHNVPTYKNTTELKAHLRRRFEAIFGKTAPGSTAENQQ